MKNNQQTGLEVTSLTLARFIPIIGALLVSVALTRILSQELYGHYRSVWLLFVLAGPILSSSINNTLYHRTEQNTSGAVLGSGLVMSLIAGVMLGGIILFGASFWAEVLNIPHLVTAIQYFGIYVVGTLVSGIAEPVFMMLHRKKWLLSYNLINSVTEFALVAGLFYLGWSITEVLAVLLWLPILRSFFIGGLIVFNGASLRSGTLEVKRSFGYMTGLFWMGFAGYAAYQIDTWLIRLLVSDDALFATYEIGARKIPLVGAVVSALASTLLMRYSGDLSSKRHEAFVLNIRKASGLLVRLIVPGLFVLFVFSEEFLTILYQKYAAAAPVFRIYLVIVLTNFLLFDVYLLARGKSKTVAIISWGELIVNISLSYGLFLLIGWLGPPIATLSGHIAYVAGALWFIHSRYQVDVRSLMPDIHWFSILILGLLTIVLQQITDFMQRPVVEFLISGMIILAVWFILNRKVIKSFTEILKQRRRDNQLL